MPVLVPGNILEPLIRYFFAQNIGKTLKEWCFIPQASVSET